jgi:hypothetical protein
MGNRVAGCAGRDHHRDRHASLARRSVSGRGDLTRGIVEVGVGTTPDLEE